MSETNEANEKVPPGLEDLSKLTTRELIHRYWGPGMPSVGEDPDYAFAVFLHSFSQFQSQDMDPTTGWYLWFEMEAQMAVCRAARAQFMRLQEELDTRLASGTKVYTHWFTPTQIHPWILNNYEACTARQEQILTEPPARGLSTGAFVRSTKYLETMEILGKVLRESPETPENPYPVVARRKLRGWYDNFIRHVAAHQGRELMAAACGQGPTEEDDAFRSRLRNILALWAPHFNYEMEPAAPTSSNP